MYNNSSYPVVCEKCWGLNLLIAWMLSNFKGLRGLDDYKITIKYL